MFELPPARPAQIRRNRGLTAGKLVKVKNSSKRTVRRRPISAPDTHLEYRNEATFCEPACNSRESDCMERQKIGIVGAGSVGATIAYACMVRGIGRHISIYDIARAKVEAEVLDLNHGLMF